MAKSPEIVTKAPSGWEATVLLLLDATHTDHLWTIATHIEDVSVKEMRTAWKPRRPLPLRATGAQPRAVRTAGHATFPSLRLAQSLERCGLARLVGRAVFPCRALPSDDVAASAQASPVPFSRRT
jgi:hypothetical protein